MGEAEVGEFRPGFISRARFGDSLQGKGSRIYASLSFTFETWLSLPGEPKERFAELVTIPAPESIEVQRFSFNGEARKPLGGSGDPLLDSLDDSLVYVKQATKAATEAATLIAEQLFGPAPGKTGR